MPEVVAASGSSVTVLPKWPHFSLPPTAQVAAAGSWARRRTDSVFPEIRKGTAQIIHLPAPEMFNPKSGRLHASRIAGELNVPVTTIAVAIGRKAHGVRKHPDSSSLQSELRRIYPIWLMLVELFAGNKAVARQFLNAPNRALDCRAPIEFIEIGDLSPLKLYVDSMTARQPI
jgi:hypothetical protein